MRTSKHLAKLVLLSLVCLLLLSACSDADWDAALDALIIWAEGQGYIQNEQVQVGALAKGVMQGYVNELANEEASVQLDGLGVVDEHEKANQLSDQAMQNLDNAAMEDALDLRPYDWTIHDKNGVLLGTQGQSDDAQEAFIEADTLLLEGLGPEDDCREARIAQLDQRLENIRYQIQLQENATGQTNAELHALEQQTVMELDAIYGTNSTPEFCR